MLRPPGSSSTRTGGPGSARATSRKTAATEQTPDEVIRGLQRLPPNKRCCDCQSKLPSCVNLTIGSFVCISCAGVHRELTHKVKGVGHSSFTADEAAHMKETDNDKVNALYLARYNPSHERMKQPMDNSDMQHVKAWIHRKYKDRLWYQNPGGGGGGGGGPATPQRQQPQQGGGGTYGQPTMAQIPPKQQPQKQPEVDLFGGSSGGGGGGWDAFGSGNAQATPQPNGPAPAASPAVAPFQADFGAFQQQQQQSNAAFPADFGSSQTQQQFQQQQNVAPQSHHPPPQAQQQQPMFQANFASFPTTPSNQQQPPQQQSQPPQVPSQSQSQQPSFQANFGQFPNPPTPQGGYANGFAGQQQPPPQQPQQQLPMQHGAGFAANFSSQAQNAQGPNSVNVPSPHQPHGGPQQPPSAMASASNVMSSLPSPGSVGKDAIQSSADAISNMSISGMGGGGGPSPSTLAAPPTESKPTKASYSAGQKVYYKSASYSGAAEVVKVHLDDDLVPYYTIRVDGKEKQTDDAHLSAMVSSPREQVESLLGDLSDSQLEQVVAFIRQLKGEPSQPPQPLPGSAGPTPSLSAQVSASGNNTGAPGGSGGLAQSSHPPQLQQQQQQHHGSMPPGAAQNPAGQQGWNAAQQHMMQQPAQMMHPAMLQNMMMAQYQMALLQQQQQQQQKGMAPGQAPNMSQPQPPQQGMHPNASHAQQAPPPNGQGGMTAPVPANHAMMPHSQMNIQPNQSQMAQQQQGSGMNPGGAPAAGGFSGIPSPPAAGNPAVPGGAAAASNIPAPPLAVGSAHSQMSFPQTQQQQYQPSGNPSMMMPQPAQPPSQMSSNVNGGAGQPQAPLSPQGNPFDFY